MAKDNCHSWKRRWPAKIIFLGQFSVADGYLFTVLRWTNVPNIDISGYPNINAIMKRMAARPAVQEAMKAEGL